MPDVSEFTILQSYKINTLNPEYWVEIEMDDIAVDSNNMISGPTIADADPLGVYPSVLEQSSSKEKKTRATSIFIRDNVVLDGTVNVQGIIQNQHLMIHHPAFNADAFLEKVHSETSYHDIMQGMRKLEKDAEENKDELRTLIRNHFDQFILAQRTVESLHVEMKKKYADNIPTEVVEFARSVRETQIKFKDQMQPLLDRNDRIKGVQESLGVLEMVKVFTDLPKSIKECRIKKNYEDAVIEFKRGKMMLQDTLKSNNQSKIDYFNLVWKSAEKQVLVLQTELMELLEQDNSDQEETLVFLMELEFPASTVWTFIEERSRRFQRSFDQELAEFTPMEFKFEPLAIDLLQLQLNIVKITKSASNIRIIESAYNNHPEYVFWKLILNVVKKIADVLCGPLTNFWKLTQVFVGENQNESNLQEIEKTRHLLEQTMTYIADELVIFWQLNEKQSIFDVVSQSPIITCFYLERILNELSRVERDLVTFKYANGEPSCKKILAVFERIKLKGLMITSTAWALEAKQIGESCNGIEIKEIKEFENSALSLFAAYQEHILKNVLNIASYSTMLDGDMSTSALDIISFYGDSANNIHPMILEKIRDSFVESLYAFIVEMTRSVTESTDKMMVDDTLPLKCLAQIRVLKEKLIPDLISKFQEQTSTSLSSAALKIFKLINDIDDSVFRIYVVSKAKFVNNEIEMTWSSVYFNWPTIKEPRGT